MPKPDLVDLDVAELAADLVPGSDPPYGMTEGLTSRTYGVDAGGDRYVLRIGADRSGFDKDAYAARAFGSAGLPVPAVERVGVVGAYAYCLSRRLPGTPVNQVAQDAMAPVVDALHLTLHELWRQDVGASSGFGMFDHTGDGAFASWRDYLTDPSPVPAAADRGPVPPGVAERLHRYVVERADDCPEERSLLHGDFGSANTLTDGHAVTGVLDWELAGYGDRLHDVAEILQWEGGEPCMTALATRVRGSLPRDPGTWRRIDCYRAKLCLVELAWGVEATLPWMVGIATSLR